MRYYVISDIHSNLDALESVLGSIDKAGSGAIINLGDIVGYGAEPGKCIARIQEISPKVLIAGNHEWGVLGLLELGYFNEFAQEAILRTKKAIRDNEIDYIKSFRLKEVYNNMEFVHGSLDFPQEFRYIFDEASARATSKLMCSNLSFVGHSHSAGIYEFAPSGPGRPCGSKAEVKDGHKYVVNAGSVGQPRDGDPRASYAIYDEEEGVLEIRRVIYDVKAARRKIIEAGIPPWLGDRLLEGR